MDIEILGLISTIMLIISMAWRNNSSRNIVIMRTFNAVSCIGFIIYSIFLSAYSTILSNSIILLIDIWYLTIELNKYRKERNNGKV